MDVNCEGIDRVTSRRVPQPPRRHLGGVFRSRPPRSHAVRILIGVVVSRGSCIFKKRTLSVQRQFPTMTILGIVPSGCSDFPLQELNECAVPLPHRENENEGDSAPLTSREAVS
ncbi:hypothetical protein ACJJTC_018615 [Scirpophaga incertulas]